MSGALPDAPVERPTVTVEAILLKDRLVVVDEGLPLPIVTQFDAEGDPLPDEALEDAEYIVFGAPGHGFFNIRLRAFRTQYTFH
jgi:hypothetical protein